MDEQPKMNIQKRIMSMTLSLTDAGYYSLQKRDVHTPEELEFIDAYEKAYILSCISFLTCIPTFIFIRRLFKMRKIKSENPELEGKRLLFSFFLPAIPIACTLYMNFKYGINKKLKAYAK
jgi:hypothetical protein